MCHFIVNNINFIYLNDEETYEKVWMSKIIQFPNVSALKSKRIFDTEISVPI